MEYLRYAMMNHLREFIMQQCSPNNETFQSLKIEEDAPQSPENDRHSALARTIASDWVKLVEKAMALGTCWTMNKDIVQEMDRLVTEVRKMVSDSRPGRGLFIVFEGADRSGKSTQALKLVEHLNSTRPSMCKLVRFPDRTSPSGLIINDFLTHKDLVTDKQALAWISHALFAYNRWEQMTSFLDDLRSGTTIICDRYSFSGVSYSREAQKLPVSLTSLMEFGLLRPDFVIQPVTSSATTALRPGFGDERYETTELQTKIKQFFTRFQALPWWKSVNGDQSIDEVHLEILEICSSSLSQKDSGDLEDLKILTVTDLDV